MTFDSVNSPAHYCQNGGVECIEAIEASMELEAFKGFLKGNCMKYLFRYEKKNGIEDLKKCEWYLLRLIELLDVEEEKIEECKDGFCPMPTVRQGPAEHMFDPIAR